MFDQLMNDPRALVAALMGGAQLFKNTQNAGMVDAARNMVNAFMLSNMLKQNQPAAPQQVPQPQPQAQPKAPMQTYATEPIVSPLTANVPDLSTALKMPEVGKEPSRDRLEDLLKGLSPGSTFTIKLGAPRP